MTTDPETRAREIVDNLCRHGELAESMLKDRDGPCEVCLDIIAAALREQAEEIERLIRIEHAAIAYCLTSNSADKTKRLGDLCAALTKQEVSR